MNKSIIAALLLLNIAFSSAGFLNKRTTLAHNEETVLAQLDVVQNSEFGRKILDTIALQLKNKSPVSEIAKMLAEIRQDLVLQEHEADSEHARQLQECDDEISDYANRIDVAQVTRDDAQSEITLLQGEIANLRNEITNKAKQLEILDNREQQLRGDREQDAFDFAARSAQTTEVLGAIDLILEKLSGIAPDSSAESVMLQLTKIGKSNPIMALAQVASSFSADSLKKVVGKVEELRESLESSLSKDTNDEEQAIVDFNTLLGEIATTRKNIANAKSEAEGQLAQSEAALNLQSNILEEAVEELAASLSGKANKERVCEDWTSTWSRNKEVRQTELGLIAQVQNIVATKLDTALVFLKQRLGDE